MRNWVGWIGGSSIWLAFGFMAIMFSLNSANSFGELALVGTFFAVICYLVSLATMFSYVKVTPAYLVVVNPGSFNSMPWREIRNVNADRGLSVEADGLGLVECYAFQSSLAGRLMGYPGARRAAKRINQFRVEKANPVGGDQSRREVPWRRHLIWFLSGWVAFSLLIPLLASRL
ncbi:hypothetical protein [Micromonospora musae]|uniref:hypothetical protein n=1 Tax=Micromonospora musae TaxID=1894970 RepID=UPI00342CE591